MSDLDTFLQRSENLSAFDLLDESATGDAGVNTLVRVHQATAMGERYRVTVHLAGSRAGSYAHVDVLTPAWVWSRLVDSPPAYWWADTQPGGDAEQIARNLGWVADELLIRGHRIAAAGPVAAPAVKPSRTLQESLRAERHIAGARILRIIGEYTVDNVHGLTSALEEYAARLQAR